MYRTQSSDTSIAAEQRQINLLRQVGPVKCAQQALFMSAEMIHLSRIALHRLHPELSEDELKLLWIEINYGKALADKVRLKWPRFMAMDSKFRL